MQIKTLIKLFCCFLVNFIFIECSYPQNISVDLRAVDSLDTAHSEDKVFDVNGEICSLVIMSTDLDSLRFYSNLGVEKIMKIENGYKIWIHSQTTILKCIIPGFPLFEYLLPHSEYKYSVYIISLKTQNIENIILKDTTQQSLSISTFPTKARIFLNGNYEGKSPIIIKNPDFVIFDYSIKKKGYELFHSKDSLDIKIKNISIVLKDIFRNKRYFATLNIKLDQSFQSQVDDHGMLGIIFGVIGKTGMYGSLNILYVDEDAVTTSFRPRYPDFYKYSKGQKVSIMAGVTQQLGKSFFLFGGPGYIARSYEKNGIVDSKSNSIVLNSGLLFRIGWFSIIQIDYSKNINNRYSSIGFGLGYHFSKKSKDKINNVSQYNN